MKTVATRPQLRPEEQRPGYKESQGARAGKKKNEKDDMISVMILWWISTGIDLSCDFYTCGE